MASGGAALSRSLEQGFGEFALTFAGNKSRFLDLMQFGSVIMK